MSTSDIFSGKWKQMKGKIQETWGELSGDEVDQIEGNKERLLGKLQEKYGFAKAEAEQKVNELLKKIS